MKANAICKDRPDKVKETLGKYLQAETTDGGTPANEDEAF